MGQEGCKMTETLKASSWVMVFFLACLCFLAGTMFTGCSESNNNGESLLGNTTFTYTISNHTGYDIVVRHVNRDRYDWSGGYSPQENFNNVRIPSKMAASRVEVSAKYRSDSGREDIYLDVYEKGTDNFLFTSNVDNFYVANNACHNSNYVMEVIFSDPRLRTIWMHASGESFLNVYPKTPGGSDWMGGLDQNLTLAQIAIPGTHDSGAFNSSRACECQSNTPVQQLEMGVRSFDFRLACNYDELVLVHGNIQSWGCNFNFTHVAKSYLLGFRDFLNSHPTESIMIHMKKESDPLTECYFSDVGEGLYDLLNDMESEGLKIMKVYDRFPTLAEAAGKVLIFHEPDVDGCCAYPIRLDWASETKRQEVDWGSSGAKFIIQDAYKNNSSDKWDIVRNILGESSENNDPQTLYYNYTSCVAGGSPNPAGEAENINEWLATWLSRYPGVKPKGCIIMDYINCGSFGGTGVTWYCSSGGHDLMPFMIYNENY